MIYLTTYVLVDLLNHFYVNELYSTPCAIVLRGRITSAIRETEHIIYNKMKLALETEYQSDVLSAQKKRLLETFLFEHKTYV